MPMAERKATTVWSGALADGAGSLSLNSSGVAKDLPVSWAARTESPDGKTSPEELIAGAQASCYAMALSNVLSQAGHTPEQLSVEATCTLDMVDGGPKVTKVDIVVSGKVSGLDQSGFNELAQQAEHGCPIANSLRGNVEISVTANLSS